MTLPLDTIITRADGGVLRATFDAPPINLIGSEIVRDLVTLLDKLSRPSGIRVVTSTVPTATSSRMSMSPRSRSTQPRRRRQVAPVMSHSACSSVSSAKRPSSRTPSSAAGPVLRAVSSRWPATCGSRRGSARSSASPKLVSAPLPGPTAFSTWPGYWAEATRSR